MESGGDVVEMLSADLDSGFDLGDGKLGQTDGGLAHAVLGANVRGHPLQGRDTTGVQADPLGFTAVYADGHAHATGAKLKRESVGKRACIRGIFEDTQPSRLEINLDDAGPEEVGTKKAIHGLRAGGTELAEVKGDVIGGQRNIAGPSWDASEFVAGEGGGDAANIDCCAAFKTEAVCGAAVDDARAGAGVEEEVDAIGGADSRVDPEQPFAGVEGDFHRGGNRRLHVQKKHSGGNRDGPRAAHERVFAWGVPARWRAFPLENAATQG